MTYSMFNLAVRSDCWGRIHCKEEQECPQGDEVKGPGIGGRRQAGPGSHFGGNDGSEVGRLEYPAQPRACKQALTTCWMGFDDSDSPLPNSLSKIILLKNPGI